MPQIPQPSSLAFAVRTHRSLNFFGGFLLALAWLALSAAQAQTTTYTLGASARLEGPAVGIDSVVLAENPDIDIWTATANANWLHLSPASQIGAGSAIVVFGCDANPGATRSGTLTIAGQTLTVTQAGTTYVEVGATTLVSNGLNQPSGVAVDGAGNVYIADQGNSAIRKWSPANVMVTTLVSSGLNQPEVMAVDGAGNLYIADTGNNAIKEWTAANGNVTTLLSSGLNGPKGVAVDGAGNLYIADTGNNALKEWTAANGNVTALVSSGLSGPQGVAVDAAGNVYITDTGNNALKEWTAANSNVTTLVSSGLNLPLGVAVDGAGNVYVAGFGDNTIKKWTAANGAVTTLLSVGLNYPGGVAVDGAGNIYISDEYNNAIKELPYAFVDSTPRLESSGAGSDALPVVLPATANLLPPFAPYSDQPWLAIPGITNNVVSFSFTANTNPIRTAHIGLLGQSIPVTQLGTTNYSLGATARLEGPTAGIDSVVLAVGPSAATWTNTANAAWLHLSPANQGGTGSANVVFSFDANPGRTRSGTLTIVGQTLTVTQAGSTYVAAGAVTALVSNGLVLPSGVAVDGAGNVYIADSGNSVIRRWSPTNNMVTTLVSSGLNQPEVMAVDGAGNLYIADTDNNAIKKWTAANDMVSALVSSGLGGPKGVAVDGAGNVYVADTGNNAIKVWAAANGNVTTLVSSGLNGPQGVAVDAAGNVYITDTGNNAIKEWTVANGNVTTLVSSGLNLPLGVAVDGAGNVYVAGFGDNTIKEWTAANGAVTTLLSEGLNYPGGVAVDVMGNIYISDENNNAVKELSYAFVDPTPRLERDVAGSDALPVVVPATENLLPPFAPTSDQSWLTITGITNGVVSFSFTANTNPIRKAHIGLLGQSIPVTQQGGTNYSLGATARLEGPTAGSDTTVLAVTPATATWTNMANAAWLHLSLANHTGTGSTNVVFSFDANPGPTRSGALTVAGQTLVVTQAGSNYVAAGQLTTLVSLGENTPYGVAVDGAGNVCIADSGNDAILSWVAAQNIVSLLVSLQPSYPQAVSLDGAGNVYFANSGNSAIEKWTAASSNLITLVSNGLSFPGGLAVDGAGNVYIADTFNNAIKEWAAADSNVTTLVSSGLSYPYGVAVDGAGNVYIADTGNNAIKEWSAATSIVTTLVSGLNDPQGLAVDGAGNVYIADTDNYPIKEWKAASNIVTPLVSLGSSYPSGVAVDGAGNVYFSQTDNNAVRKLPYAFVDPAPRLESAAAGDDVLPQVLPSTENLLPPFAPTSDQSWLAITGITNGVVSFSFTANTGPARSAHISLLGQSIPITQGLIGTPPTLTGAQMLGNGVIQFAFTNAPGASFTVLSSANLSLPLSNWSVVGTASDTSPGMFQFTSQPATNDAQRFYRVRSP